MVRVVNLWLVAIVLQLLEWQAVAFKLKYLAFFHLPHQAQPRIGLDGNAHTVLVLAPSRIL